MTDITPWQKATASDTGNCVELRRNRDAVEFRDSKDPHGAILRYTTAELIAFLDGAKRGEFDHLAVPYDA
jgi:hypothetical protein